MASPKHTSLFLPLKITKLGLNHKDYANIAKNVNRILNMPNDKWQNILNRANNELSSKLRTIAHPIIKSMAYDREFFKKANLCYSNGPLIQEGFITALADYLLRNMTSSHT